jgi:hypothetical protein
LPELLVAVGISSLLLAVVLAVNVFGAKSFVSIGNYVNLDCKSRNTLDVLSREIRNATAVVSFQTNLPIRSLTLTNATLGKTISLTYNATARTLVFTKTGQPAQTFLTECDRWDFALYSRAPVLSSNNITFHFATNAAGALDVKFCKLINMSWKCSRTIIGSKQNTESVQTAQIVLRNKVN